MRALGLMVAIVAATAACKSGASTTPAAAGGGGDARAFIAAVTLCETREDDLRAKLGSPTRDGRLGRQRIVSWIVGDSDVVAYLAVLLDDTGRVIDLYWDVPTEVPWTPIDRCAPALPLE